VSGIVLTLAALLSTMTRTRAPLLIVDPSVSHPEDAGIARIAEGWGGEVRVLQPALRGDGPREGTGYEASAVVVLGSRASVHDGLPWERELSAWLRPIVAGEVEVPLLGICFGHQLIAHVAGGAVGYVRPDHAKLVGTAESRLDCGRLLGPTNLRVVVSHREEVKALPAGFRVCSQREAVLFDGIEHERLPIFSFQFHPEAGGDFLRERGVQVSADEAEALLQDSRRLIAAFVALALR
jgi:GMP synthase-like glutamine amidotransferase